MSRELLYHDADYNDHAIATYVTNYCYALVSLFYAWYLLRSRPFKLNLRDRYYSSGFYFIFTAISNIIAGLTHQFISITPDTTQQPIFYWIAWAAGMTALYVNSILHFTNLTIIHSQNK